MNLRVWENPWRLLLAVNAAVLAGVFWHKITLPPFVPYIHLLVDYHFGFTKRALIGAIVGLFDAKVPVWLVFALGGAVWLLTAGLFVQLFRREPPGGAGAPRDHERRQEHADKDAQERARLGGHEWLSRRVEPRPVEGAP